MKKNHVKVSASVRSVSFVKQMLMEVPFICISFLFIPIPGIEVVPTPGHTATCVSVIVLNTELGIVAVTGDLFEKRDDIFEPHIWEHLAGSENPLKQSQSRQKVVK